MGARPPKYDWPIKWPSSEKLTRGWLGLILFVAALLTIVPALYVIARFMGALVLGDSEDVRNIGLIFLAVIGAPFVIWRAFVAQGNLDRSRDRDYADLFTKAVEQLGATREVREWDEEAGREVVRLEPNIEVRLGAIYALERISQDSERDHIAVMETLCAYVRENAPKATGEPTPSSDLRNWIIDLSKPREDVAAAIKALGKINRQVTPTKLRGREFIKDQNFDLSGLNLQSADLSCGVFDSFDFVGSRLEGASLLESSFVGCVFWGTRLQGSELSLANFEGAAFAWAELGQAKVDLADFTGAFVAMADFEGVAGLKLSQIEASIGCAGTKLPAEFGYPRPRHWYEDALSDRKALSAAFIEWKTKNELASQTN